MMARKQLLTMLCLSFPFSVLFFDGVLLYTATRDYLQTLSSLAAP